MNQFPLVEEIREAFANLNPGQRGELEALPDDCPAWAYVLSSAMGVALPIADGVVLSERFAGARLYTERFGGRTELRLESTSSEHRNEFAVVCAQLLEPGEHRQNRVQLLASPTDWWNKWRTLLGNVAQQRQPHSVLGELLALEKLLLAGSRPRWLGPHHGSHDIEADDASYEVKSTLSKYSSKFQVAGQFQLQEVAGKPLFVVHQRFEHSITGESIDAVTHRLARLTNDVHAIENELIRLGFETGCSDRRTTYQLIESTRYIVNENFPRITGSSFAGGVVPQGIVAIRYEVELAGLVGEPFT